MKRILVIAAALLALPPSAAAVPDAGQTFCGQIRDQANPPVPGCVTIEPTDEYKPQAPSGPYSGYLNPATGKIDSTPAGAGCSGPPYTCTATSWYFVNRQYGRRHQYSTLTWRNVQITWISADGVNVLPVNLRNTSIMDDSRLNKPDCPVVNEGELNGGNPTLLADPALLLAVCGITKPTNDTPTGETPTNETTTTAPLRRCAAFKHGRKNVAVTSRGVACAPARNLLARFVRRGVEPAGYVCVKVRLGRMVAAKCRKVPSGKARAAAKPIVVEGRWRR